MIKSQKKVIESYKPETIKKYILNWPINRIVINPSKIVGGKINTKDRKNKLPPPLTPTLYVPPRQRPVPAPRRPVPKPRVLSLRPTPAPKRTREQIERSKRVDALRARLPQLYSEESSRRFRESLGDWERRVDITKRNKALGGYAKSFNVSIINSKDPMGQLNSTANAVKRLLESELKREKGLKVKIVLQVVLKKEKLDSDGNVSFDIASPSFPNRLPIIITSPDEIRSKLERAFEEILNEIAAWTSRGSGFVIDKVTNHYVNIVKYEPLRGSSYIDLPQELKNPKKVLINLKNLDDKCAAWCIVRHLNPKKKKSTENYNRR